MLGVNQIFLCTYGTFSQFRNTITQCTRCEKIKTAQHIFNIIIITQLIIFLIPPPPLILYLTYSPPVQFVVKYFMYNTTVIVIIYEVSRIIKKQHIEFQKYND